MPTFSRTADIEAPAAKIWAFISDPANASSLVADRTVLSRVAVKARFDEGSVAGPGARIVSESRGRRRVWTAEVWEAPRVLKLTRDDKEYPMTACRHELEFTITPKTSLSTQVELRYAVEPLAALIKLLAPLLYAGQGVGRAMDGVLDRLKTAVQA